MMKRVFTSDPCCPCFMCTCEVATNGKEDQVHRCWPDIIAPPMYSEPPEGWIDPALPDFKLIWEVAKGCGYAVGLHGSMKRDCDLIAVPWVDRARDPEYLVAALCEALYAEAIGGAEKKPHGRVSYSIRINGYFKMIDLSIVTPKGIET